MRESLVVSFIKFVCQSSRQFCESAGDKGGSTPPALLLLLSRLCLDYETSTISYILTLTDEQFLAQVNGVSPYKCRRKAPKITVKTVFNTCRYLTFCTFSASQSSNTRHNFMCWSQGGSTETTKPLCKSKFSPLQTLCYFSYWGKTETSMQEKSPTLGFLQVQGLIISQMLRKSVETRDWVNTIEPRNVRAVMKRVVEDTTSIDVQVTVRLIVLRVWFGHR